MSKRPQKPWRPQWGYRRYDTWRGLKDEQRDLFALRFGPAFTRSGQMRLAERYGFSFNSLQDGKLRFWRLDTSRVPSDDRLRRFADYVDRTPALRAGSLERIANIIRRKLQMPHRLRSKEF